MVSVLFEEIFGEADALTAKNECIPWGEAGVEVALCRDRAEQVQPARRFGRAFFGVGMKKMSKVEMPANVDEVPIVNARPSDALVVNFEAKRTDEMKRRRRRGTKTSNVTGIRGNFRFHENNVKRAVEFRRAKPRWFRPANCSRSRTRAQTRG